jgi:F0F1-type ATP synthase membrane subunit a
LMQKTLTDSCKANAYPVLLLDRNGIGIFWIEAYREDHTIKRKTEMRTKQITGLLGSITLFIGVFVPLISIPTIGNMNYFTCSKKSDVMITLVLAICHLFLCLRKNSKHFGSQVF